MNTDKKHLRLCLYLCLSVPHVWLFSLPCDAFGEAPQFTVRRDQSAGPALVGFGAQMNPYLYCHPNWGPQGVNEQNVKNLERKVIDLAPQHVRIFCLLNWFTPAGDTVIAKGDPRMEESFLRTVQLAQKAGASVNLTFWYGLFSLEKKGVPDPPDLLETTARDMTAVMKELLVDRKLSAIRYVTIQNEVNGEGSDGAPFKISMEQYSRLYHLFDQSMRAAGLRDRIQIVGGDLIYRQQEQWIPFLSSHLQEVCDGYSMHAYWDYWDTPKLTRRLDEVRDLFDAQPADQHKPLYVTEFGVRGKRPKPAHDDPGYFNVETRQQITDAPLQAVQIAWFMMEAVNRGYVATVQWDLYDALYDHVMHYGMIGDVATGWKIRPSYGVLKLFTHSTRPGWRALHVDGADEGCVVSAVTDGKSNYTVFALNHASPPDHADAPRSADPDRSPHSMIINGLPAHTRFNAVTWNGSNSARPAPAAAPGPAVAPALRSDARGALSITLAPATLLVLTTAPRHD
jgi:hypothetical protein